MMEKKLYVAWQSQALRSWHTVGVLTHTPEEGYLFRYVRGALAAREVGFPGISSFPDMDRTYQSDDLFAFFANRIISSARPQYAVLLQQVAMEAPTHESKSPDYVFDFLSRTRGWRTTDTYEMFAPVQATPKGFRWDFFTRGLSHTDKANRERWTRDAPTLPLRAVLDFHNGFDRRAIIIIDDQHSSLGFVPGNYSAVIHAIVTQAEHIDWTILRQNREERLEERRFLIEMNATMPPDFELPRPAELEVL